MAPLPESQYQHFVPQFLLRNFSHPFKPTGPRRKGKARQNNGLRPGDTVVRSIDLTLDTPVICEKPIKRILGQMNMYDDTTKPSLQEQRKLEELFGKFENQVARIFSKIVKAHAEHQEKPKKTQQDRDTNGGVCLTRPERDCLRKFLFILHYRSSRLRQRFDHETAAEYNDNDKEFVQEHMEEKGYQRPLDVWFDNLKAIIEIDMDVEGKWRDELPKRMFPDDAMGFIIHTDMYFMSICTPADPADEFVLVDNAYGIFEGPSTFTRDKETGELEGSAYSPLHYFAPVSPKLMILCRSNLLPNPLEDVDEKVKEWREQMRTAALDNIYSEDLISMCRLKELPVAKARNNYTQIVNGRLTGLPGYDGTRRKDHRFFFDIFPINSWHVNMINSILLDNAAACTSVVFKSASSLAKTLEWYLAAPCDIAGKIMLGEDGEDKRKIECLRKLEVISRSLGSTRKTVTSRLAIPSEDPAHDVLREIFTNNRKMWKKLAVDDDKEMQDLIKRMANPEEGFFLSYVILGGTRDTVEEDLDQARRMWELRVCIDKWSAACGVEQDIRHRNRNLLEAAYRNLPPRRFLVYAKIWRAMALQHYARADPAQRRGQSPKVRLFGPEDTIVKLRLIVKDDHLNQLIHNVITIETRHREPGSLWPDIWDIINPFDPASFSKCCIVKAIIGELGFIRDCGIKEVEDLARQTQIEILRRGLHNPTKGLQSGWTVFDFLEEGERVELMTRMIVRERFTGALKNRVRSEPLKNLKEVLFEYAYPAPPVGWR